MFATGTNFVRCFIIILAWFSHFSNGKVKRVTCNLEENNNDIDEEYIGRPGKRGPAGPPGRPGTPCNCSEIEDLKKRVEKLENIVKQQARIEDVSSTAQIPTMPTVKKPTSCKDITQRKSGIYTLFPFKDRESDQLVAYCDFDTLNGPWLVIQRRVDGSEDFYLPWKNYVDGFGDTNKEFWLGLEYMHLLTEQDPYILRVDLEDFEGGKAYAIYKHFKISSAENGYALNVTKYSGNAGDSLKIHNHKKFGTKDKNDFSCAQKYRGAWWFASCHHAHLNGPYGKGKIHGYGIVWLGWKGYYQSLKRVEMKITLADAP